MRKLSFGSIRWLSILPSKEFLKFDFASVEAAFAVRSKIVRIIFIF